MHNQSDIAKVAVRAGTYTLREPLGTMVGRCCKTSSCVIACIVNDGKDRERKQAASSGHACVYVERRAV